MLARDVVTLFQRRLGGHLNRVSMLDEIKLAQDEIMCLPDVDFTKSRGNTFLETTDGVQEYTLASPTRIVTRIFTRSTNPDSYAPDQPQLQVSDPAWVTIGTTPCTEQDVTFECNEALSFGDDCLVRFPAEFNPGTSTDLYLIESYSWPSRLTSESIAMSLPDPWITSLLFYAVKKRVEESQYGVDIYNDPKFKEMMRSFLTRQANHPRTEKIVRKVRF